jgi:hypothetical protein
MSGYLQRLVDGAAGHGHAVHPRTGSIFAPQEQEATALVHGGEDHESAALTPLHARPPDASPSGESAQPADRVARGFDPTPLFPPLSPIPAVRTMVSAPLNRAAGPDDRNDVVDPDRRLREPRGARGDPPADVRVGAKRVGETEETSPFLTTPVRVSEPRVQSDDPQRLRSEQAAHGAAQSDDIQIHIGRIEVIAVPPAAAPGPKAPDRSVSLEAYLNRRDGRGR